MPWICSDDVDNLSKTQRELIDAVIDTYGGINTFKLVDLTHQPRTPWFTAHYPDGDTESSQYSAPISKESIRQYFQQEAKRVKAGGEFIT